MALSMVSHRDREAPPTDRSVFRFLDLPAEIRNQIYSLTLEFSRTIIVCPLDMYERYETLKWSTPISVSILRVCRRITHEALPIFCGNNTFRFALLQGDPSRRYSSRFWLAYLEDLATNQKYASLLKSIIVTRSDDWYLDYNILSEVRMVYKAKNQGIKIELEYDWHSEPNAVLEALVYTLADHYHTFSSYERSISGIYIHESLKFGSFCFYTSTGESPKADKSWNPTEKYFSIMENGKKVSFSTPERYLSELPGNVLLRIAELAEECDEPIKIALTYDQPYSFPRDRTFSGNLQVNPFLHGSPPYYFNNTKFKVLLNMCLARKTTWNKQLQPLTTWAKQHLPYHGLGTPLPFRHITFIIDLVDRYRWIRSRYRNTVFRISILELIRLFVHIHQDSLAIIFRTPWSTIMLSLKDLRHLALVFLTQAFGLDYSEERSATFDCPRIELDGRGALRVPYPCSSDPSIYPDKRYYESDHLDELLTLFRKYNRTGELSSWYEKSRFSRRYDELRSAKNCIDYLREVLSEPNRVKEIAATYYMPRKERAWPKSPWDG